MPHVFQAYYPILDQATAALDRAGQLLTAHLAGAARVTAKRQGSTRCPHSPRAAGPDPAPATSKYQVRLIAGERPPGRPAPGPSAHPGIVTDRSST